MKEVILRVPVKEYRFFMKLVESLGFVQVEESDTHDSRKNITKNLKQGFKEMKLIKEGKLKSTPAEDFLDEL